MTEELILPSHIVFLLEDVERCIAEEIADLPEGVVAELASLSGEGKRLRALLVLLSCLLSGKEHPLLVKTAVACELLHLATLIHDDLIDGHTMRRGHPALYTKIEPAAAVLAADVLFARAYALFLECRSFPVLTVITRTLASITATELQAHQNTIGRSLKLTDYLDWISGKTASLFSASATCGAILAGFDRESCMNLRQMGELIGLAFQIRDDILDYKNKKGGISNPASDLHSGLVTLPLILLIQEEGFFPEYEAWFFGSREPDVISTLSRKVFHSRSLTAADDYAMRYAQEASDIAGLFPVSSVRDGLQRLCLYAVTRTR